VKEEWAYERCKGRRKINDKEAEDTGEKIERNMD
jgi:hypothetical protein